MIRTRILQTSVVLLYAVFALSLAASPASAGWFADGSEITEPLSTETEAESTFEDTETIVGAVSILCKFVLDGTVGSGELDETKEVLNLAKEKVGELGGLALLGTGATSGEGSECKTVKICAEGTSASPIELWPRNLPWLTELEGMESEPSMLDKVFGTGAGKEPGWEILCLILGINTEDTCEGRTSAEITGTSGGPNLLELLNSGAPINSEKLLCTQSNKETGAVVSEGTILLTSGKVLGYLDCLNKVEGEYETYLDCIMNPNLPTGNFIPGWDDVIEK